MFRVIANNQPNQASGIITIGVNSELDRVGSGIPNSFTFIVIDVIIAALPEVDVQIDTVTATVDIDPRARAVHIPIASH